MTGCSALNCSERSEKGVKMYQIPTNVADPRRSVWIINSRRKAWIPNRNSYYCEKHFEESQFEMVAGIKKLRKNAIPTLFKVPNLPPKISKSRRKYEFKRRPLIMKNSNIVEHESLPSDEDISDSNVDFNELLKRHNTLRRNYTIMKENYDNLAKRFENLKTENETLKSILGDENSKRKQELKESTELENDE